MVLKKKRTFIGFLFLTILLIGFISAGECSIKSSCNEANTIMKLSDTTNAHGSLYDQGTYTNYLCCDFEGTHTCSGSNKVVGLSSPTNAHAEIPENSIYGTDVCFVDLNCESSADSCPLNKTAILSLSDTTNAHLGGPLDYPTKICCDLRTACKFSSASWNTTNTIEGTQVSLNLQGTNCDGNAVSFEVREDEFIGSDPVTTNPSNVVFNGDSATGTWTAEWINDGIGQGDPEYYFIARAVRGTATITSSTKLADELTVTQATHPCDLTSAVWSTDTTNEGQSVSLIVTGDNCDGKTISFVVWEDDLIGDDPVITNPVDVVFSGTSAIGTWTAEWQNDGLVNPDPEYYFIASVVGGTATITSSTQLADKLIVTQGEILNCTDIFLCSNYQTQGECVNDACGVANEIIIPTMDCSDPEINCECLWDGDSCIASWNTQNCGNGIIDAGETCDGTNWGSITGCSDFDNFSGGDLNCVNCQFDTSQCAGGIIGTCDDGYINTGEACDGTNWGSITGCSDFDNFSGGDLNCVNCQFDTSQCTKDLDQTLPGKGNCTISENTENDTCDELGLFTFSWTTNIDWPADNLGWSDLSGCEGAGGDAETCVKFDTSVSEPSFDGLWHYDPLINGENFLFTTCRSGSGSIKCPAQIQLPFFTWETLFATIFILGIIYFIWDLKKKKK